MKEVSKFKEYISEGTTIILVDYSWLSISSMYGYSSLGTSIVGDTVPLAVTHGLTKFIQKSFYARPNSIIIFCLDGKYGKESRKKINPEYKAHRKTDPLREELSKVQSRVMSILSTVNNVYFTIDNYLEADDLLSILSKDFRDQHPNNDIILYTPDNDMYQLLEFNINISSKIDYDYVCLTEDDIFDKYNVRSHLLLIYRALIGDKSDNLDPVFPRIRKKFAVLLSNLWFEVKDFNKVIERLKEIHPKETKLLLENKQRFYNNIKVMDLKKYHKNVELNRDYKIFKINNSNVSELITEYNLRQFESFVLRNNL